MKGEESLQAVAAFARGIKQRIVDDAQDVAGSYAGISFVKHQRRIAWLIDKSDANVVAAGGNLHIFNKGGNGLAKENGRFITFLSQNLAIHLKAQG